MAVDWQLGLMSPDYGQQFQKSFETGRQTGREHALEQAYQTFAANPQAGTQQAMAIDPQTGMALQRDYQAQQDRQSTQAAGTAVATGDRPGALLAASKLGPDQVIAMQNAFAGMDQQKRALIAQRNEQVAAVLAGIQHTTQDPAQRLSMAQHVAAQHPEFGIQPDQITADDVSDQGIQAHIAAASTLKDILARQDARNKVVVGAPGSSLFTQGQLDDAAAGQGGQPAPGAPASAPAPAQSAPAPTGGIYDQVGQVASQAGATPTESPYLQRLAQVESNGNPAARNGSSTGLFQFHPDTFHRVLPGGDITNPEDQVRAALALSRQDRSRLQQLGVEPSDANTYIMHQQGPGGGPALLTAPPTANAVDVLTPIYGNAALARKAIVGNGGTPNMTAGQFVDMWRQRWGGQSQPSAAPSGQAAPAGPQPIATVPKETGHASTPDELKRAGLPPGIAAWTDANGKPTPYSDSMQPPGHGGDSNLTGEDYLATLPKGYAAQIRAYANGDLALPTGNRAGGRDQQRLLNDIYQYDPSASAANLTSRSATRKAFTSGPYSQVVNATNTVIGHLGNLDAAIDELHNTGMSWVNGPAQAVGQAVGNQDTQRALADFNTYKTMVANELTKVYRGTGGAEADIQGWQKQLDSASSPTALHATVKAMVTGLDSRLEALGMTYSQGMGKTTDPTIFLNPHAKAIFDRLNGDGQGGGAPAGPAAGGVPVLTPLQAAKVPKGTHFRTTDGRDMIRQ